MAYDRRIGTWVRHTMEREIVARDGPTDVHEQRLSVELSLDMVKAQ